MAADVADVVAVAAAGAADVADAVDGKAPGVHRDRRRADGDCGDAAGAAVVAASACVAHSTRRTDMQPAIRLIRVVAKRERDKWWNCLNCHLITTFHNIE